MRMNIFSVFSVLRVQASCWIFKHVPVSRKKAAKKLKYVGFLCGFFFRIVNTPLDEAK